MKLRAVDPNESRVVVLAPQGRDAEVIALVLSGAGHEVAACASLGNFLKHLHEGAAVGIVTEETLKGDEMPALSLWMARQPPWSDFPLLVLATRQTGRRPPQAMAMLEGLGNVVLLERPLNAETLVSAARAASRSRARQYDTRFHLDEQQRIHRENERLYEAESRALRQAAESRDALLSIERFAREQAEHGNRTKEEFLATLSHELRTPLSAILGWVYVLKAQAATPADVSKGVDVIERNARAQARLIDELLDMSRIIAGSVHLDLQPVAPLAVVEAALASVQPGADAKSIAIERAFEPETGLVRADVHRLLQIVWNLLSNAVKFTPTGGTIRVEAGGRGGEFEVCVSDSGEGIAASFLPFIFDRFRQADGSAARKHGGLGLGLSIVRNLVELHQGTVHAASDGPGRGATLTVRLPLLQPQAGAAPEALPARPAERALSRAEPPVTLAGARIVVVDDEADSRDMISRILGEHGAEVRAAASAEQADAAAARGRVDLMVTDIGMPKVDGYELLERLRRHGHRFPVVALTAFAREEDRTRALAMGFSAHLAKPFEAIELVSLAARLTTNKEPADERR